jgi:hypothetical protein
MLLINESTTVAGCSVFTFTKIGFAFVPLSFSFAPTSLTALLSASLLLSVSFVWSVVLIFLFRFPVRCTTYFVSISRPVCVLCCCWIRSVVLLVLLYYSFRCTSCFVLIPVFSVLCCCELLDLLYVPLVFFVVALLVWCDYPSRSCSRVLCCCSVALLSPFRFPFPLVFFFLPSSYSIIGCIIGMGPIIPTTIVYCVQSPPQNE